MRRPATSRPGPYLAQVQLLRERVADPGAFPFALPALRSLDTLTFHPDVTFFVGENGSGKSTLLEALAVGCGLNAEGGSRNFRFATWRSHSCLHEALRIARTAWRPRDSWFLRAESFYNVATEIHHLDEPPGGPKVIDAYGGVSLHEQSHGESFFALFRHRFGGHGLYFLDEPEAALSPSRQLQFLALLDAYVRAGSQFVIATHSPILMAYPRARICSFGSDGIEVLPYRETEHYRVTRRFLDDPSAAMAALFRDEG